MAVLRLSGVEDNKAGFKIDLIPPDTENLSEAQSSNVARDEKALEFVRERITAAEKTVGRIML